MQRLFRHDSPAVWFSSTPAARRGGGEGVALGWLAAGGSLPLAAVARRRRWRSLGTSLGIQVLLMSVLAGGLIFGPPPLRLVPMRLASAVPLAWTSLAAGWPALSQRERRGGGAGWRRPAGPRAPGEEEGARRRGADLRPGAGSEGEGGLRRPAPLPESWAVGGAAGGAAGGAVAGLAAAGLPSGWARPAVKMAAAPEIGSFGSARVSYGGGRRSATAGSGANGGDGSPGQGSRLVEAAGFGAAAAVSLAAPARVARGSGFGDEATAVASSRVAAEGPTPGLAVGVFAAPGEARGEGAGPRVGAGAEAGVVPARVLFLPRAVYTATALAHQVEGDVVLRVQLRADAQVRILGVVRGLGYGLDEAAEAAAGRLRFQPARRDGIKIDWLATLRVQFRLAH